MRSPYFASRCWRRLFQVSVRLGKILAGRAFAFVEIRHRVEPEPVHAEIEPKVEHLADFVMHVRVVEVQVRLMGIEAVPEVGARHRDPTSSCDSSKSLKMMRASLYFSGESLHT